MNKLYELYKLWTIGDLFENIHGSLSPYEDGGGSFFRVSGGLPFHMDIGGLLYMGGVTWVAWPKSVKVNLTNCHRELCRIKFYQIVTSDVFTSLWQSDKMLFW